MNALLSIMALYNYDNSIFDNMTLPEGINKDDLISNLLLELAEFEILYPDPATMKMSIAYWSKKERAIWDKLYATTQLDYDPLSNTNRTETVENLVTHDLGGKTKHESSTSGITTNSGTDTQKEYVSAFNETSPTLAKQTEQTLGTGNVVGGHVESTDDNTDTGTIKTENTTHMTGNIGVRLTQEFIEAERKVSEFNMQDYIIRSFKNRFCLLVY